MVAWGYGVKVVATVTGEACWPSPKSPWSEVKRRGSYVGSLIGFVPVGVNGLFVYYPKFYV